MRAIIAWHFDPETGSPYWLRRAQTLGFDPRRDVRGFADLARFPPVADEWRTVPAADLIPRGARGPFAVWETGGTTGPPRRIVDARERYRGVLRISRILDLHGFPGAHRGPRDEHVPDPAAGDWLHVGPSGPHLVGTSVARLARLRGSLCHTVDLDPRWVKRLYRAGRLDEVRRYTAHVIEQALAILRTQPVTVVTTTPPLLQALCEHPEAYERLRARVKGIIWFGTSLSDEALRLLEEELLPGVTVVGWYGNTLMGIACQRPRRPGDPHRCVFVPPSPGAVVRLVDPRDPSREVGYGEEGQVRLSVLTRELFLPWHLERDRAIRVPPSLPDPWDGLARVAPLGGSGPEVEGVY
ncbi:hypothetical protein [Caldinitratiruptor microaerophilus]|uniref:Phenazine antibiotic biosynthesis protein n=1 Tax=Caldinitratiruptor microaerophilus TaxID=671077 RepID=A0AA35G7S2_9FIRM|nr:hypothetical protein [Caldinitratiruptor microaerophilus]BDG60215.1 phenazine antibiotic biosynthesis protein [Caldinitratiruptor microaerophilus]